MQISNTKYLYTLAAGNSDLIFINSVTWVLCDIKKENKNGGMLGKYL